MKLSKIILLCNFLTFSFNYINADEVLLDKNSKDALNIKNIADKSKNQEVQNNFEADSNKTLLNNSTNQNNKDSRDNYSRDNYNNGNNNRDSKYTTNSISNTATLRYSNANYINSSSNMREEKFCGLDNIRPVTDNYNNKKNRSANKINSLDKLSSRFNLRYKATTVELLSTIGINILKSNMEYSNHSISYNDANIKVSNSLIDNAIFGRVSLIYNPVPSLNIGIFTEYQMFHSNVNNVEQLLNGIVKSIKNNTTEKLNTAKKEADRMVKELPSILGHRVSAGGIIGLSLLTYNRLGGQMENYCRFNFGYNMNLVSSNIFRLDKFNPILFLELGTNFKIFKDISVGFGIRKDILLNFGGSIVLSPTLIPLKGSEYDNESSKPVKEQKDLQSKDNNLHYKLEENHNYGLFLTFSINF